MNYLDKLEYIHTMEYYTVTKMMIQISIYWYEKMIMF